MIDIDHVGREVQKNVREAYLFDCPQDDTLFYFEQMPISLGVAGDGGCGEILYLNTIRDLVNFSLQECIRWEIPVRRCRSCGRYFPITRRITAEQSAAWHQAAKARKKDCDREVISPDEFKVWLKDS